MYATEPDEFRITALRRRYAELAQSASDNETIIRLLRDEGQVDASGILQRIRSGESIASIVVGLGEEGHQAEQNLMRAIERANELTAEAATTTTTAPPAPGHDDRPRTSAERQSVAFMMNTPTEEDPPSTDPQTSAAASEVLASSPPGRSQLDPAASSGEQSHAEHSIDRPELAAPALSAIAAESDTSPTSPDLGTSINTAAALSKLRQHGKSGMSGRQNVTAAHWEVYYIDDQTFLDILRCYFALENHNTPLVNEKAFWEGLREGGLEFCVHALSYACLALGFVRPEASTVSLAPN